MAGVLGFPNPVNEVAARVVAGGVLLVGVAALVLDQPWLTLPLAYGFVARVLSGPRFSPLGLLATRVVVPRLPVTPKYVAGPPKRFAQGIGAGVTVTAAALHFGFGLTGASFVLLGVIVVAATLEAVFALCIGCQVFGALMRAGVIPVAVCERCGDIWAQRQAPA